MRKPTKRLLDVASNLGIKIVEKLTVPEENGVCITISKVCPKSTCVDAHLSNGTRSSVNIDELFEACNVTHLEHTSLSQEKLLHALSTKLNVDVKYINILADCLIWISKIQINLGSPIRRPNKFSNLFYENPDRSYWDWN